MNKKLPGVNEPKLKEIIRVVVNGKLFEIHDKKEKIDLFISKDLEENYKHINTDYDNKT